MRAVHAVVRRIPSGRVATYGQVAALAGYPRQARQVGWIMAALPQGSDVPWQRVINAKGEVSPRTNGDGHLLQRLLLEAEGVAFDRRGRVDLRAHRWEG